MHNKEKQEQYGDDLNLMLGYKSLVTTSPTKVEVDMQQLTRRSNLQLQDLPSMCDGNRVSCKVKVLRIEEKQPTPDGQSLQNLIYLSIKI